MTTKDEYEPMPIEASGRITTIVNPNDNHNRILYVTIEFPDGEVYRGYVEKEGEEMNGFITVEGHDCHPDAIECCEECLELNGYEVAEEDE
tara:strand:+ start:224 stop:496 length:273 start_codon:yes stop_codon:yes gene_type:complete